MKTNLTVILSLSILLILFGSCNDREMIPEGSYRIETGKKIEKTITGTVLDQNNNPVSNASVQLFDKFTTTDKNGYFQFYKAYVYEKHAYVKVRVPGYHLGSRSIVPTPGDNAVTIKLLPKTKVGSFNSVSGGAIAFNNVSLLFGSQFEDENGRIYSGNVNVSATYIDPTAEDIHDIMPGSLRGVSDNGESLLASYGMLGVELEDDAGNPLQIAEGSQAEMRSAIPSSLLATAPETIPLWHFDEDKGYWIQDGYAEKIGNEYVGEVNHFSFWNYDIKVDFTNSMGRILDFDGNPLSNVEAVLESPNAGTRSGYTCSKGFYGGILPADVKLKLKTRFRSNGYAIFYETEIGPLSRDGAIPDVTIPRSYFKELIQVSGTINDCNNNPLIAGRIIVNGNESHPIRNGRYNFYCLEGESHELIPMQDGSDYRGDVFSISGEEDIEIPPRQICDPAIGQDKILFQGNTESMSVIYKTDDHSHLIENGLTIIINEDENTLLMDFGKYADPTYSAIGMHILITNYNGPGIYTINSANSSEMTFFTDYGEGQQLEPINMTIEVKKVDTELRGLGEIYFYGDYKEYNPDKKRMENRRVTNGLIQYKLL